jgi:hypothetical protein
VNSGDIYLEEFFTQQHVQSRRTGRARRPTGARAGGPAERRRRRCATGTWLAVFLEHDVSDLFGVDGDYVDHLALEIPRWRFLAHDPGRPLELARRSNRPEPRGAHARRRKLPLSHCMGLRPPAPSTSAAGIAVRSRSAQVVVTHGGHRILPAPWTLDGVPHLSLRVAV